MHAWLKRVTDKFPRSLLGAAVAGLVLLLGLAGLHNLRDLKAAEAREELLERRIAERREAVEELEQRIERLHGDPMLLERLAREDLGMAYDEELVLILPGDPAASGRAVPTATIDRPPGAE